MKPFDHKHYHRNSDSADNPCVICGKDTPNPVAMIQVIDGEPSSDLPSPRKTIQATWGTSPSAPHAGERTPSNSKPSATRRTSHLHRRLRHEQARKPESPCALTGALTESETTGNPFESESGRLRASEAHSNQNGQNRLINFRGGPRVPKIPDSVDTKNSASKWVAFLEDTRYVESHL